MFVILQKYDFSSKSQHCAVFMSSFSWCLWYCKSTIFQANHNQGIHLDCVHPDVCDTAKVRFFKQITTRITSLSLFGMMFVILQKYDFSSKSQPEEVNKSRKCDVCDTAKVRFFKQITTQRPIDRVMLLMFVILQKYDFSSKSQPRPTPLFEQTWCLWYCKSTIFQANHNSKANRPRNAFDVCKDKLSKEEMFVILQKYDFSSKSQPPRQWQAQRFRCLWYCKSTIFQANHNNKSQTQLNSVMFVILQKYDFSSKSQLKLGEIGVKVDVCDTAKVRFFKQITTIKLTERKYSKMFVILQKYDFSSKSQHAIKLVSAKLRCLWYCKSTIFQANHNYQTEYNLLDMDVCDTAKVRFFKQITTRQS